MKKYDLLVIGGDAAGMSAASQARRFSSSMSIGVLEKGEHVSFAACGIPYYISGDVKDSESLIAVTGKSKATYFPFSPVWDPLHVAAHKFSKRG